MQSESFTQVKKDQNKRTAFYGLKVITRNDAILKKNQSFNIILLLDLRLIWCIEEILDSQEISFKTICK